MYEYDYSDYETSYEATQRYYKRRRLYLTVISVILLIIFLIYALAPVIQALTTASPQPAPETGPMVEQISTYIGL